MKTIVSIWFAGHRIPGGVDAILGPTQCGPDVAKIEKYEYGKDGVGARVYLTLEEGDERVAKVLALLAPYERLHSVDRDDIYSEEELQNARLLHMTSWSMYQIGGDSFMVRPMTCRTRASVVERACAKPRLSSLMGKKCDKLKRCTSLEHTTLISWSTMSLEKNS